MSNPLRAPKTPAAHAVGDDTPTGFFEPVNPDRYYEIAKKGRDVGYVRAMMSSLDMVMRNSFYLPPGLSADPRVLTSRNPVFAQAKSGKATFRVRTSEAFTLLQGVWRHIPDAPGPFGRPSIRAAVSDKFMVDGGTENTLGRLLAAYPRKGATIRYPVTQGEAHAAMGRCGLLVQHLPSNVLRKYPLLSEDDVNGITVNVKSENGFPVGVTWETPGAAAKCMELAVGVARQIEDARRGSGVEEWLRKMEREAPYMVALKGKAKADYYNTQKLEEMKMRFYNVVPRHILLNMQVATQPYEKLSRNILKEGHSGIGVSLHRGGAGELVQALENQLNESGVAYVHVGDDSWVMIREGKEEIVTFALDCSNFDLTQHHDATREVHAAFRRELQCIDPAAADLWHAYARERMVVVCGALTYQWKHAGPSGFPLQSKVNDVLMDVLINRVLAGRRVGQSERWWDNLISSIGVDLGFSVKVEQFARVRARSVVGLLEQRPFLFVGYYFHVREGEVRVCSDVPRALSQMPYPGLKWIKLDKDRVVMEAMRLGSQALGAGLPPVSLEKAFEAWRDGVKKLLRRAIEISGDAQDDRLRWAVGEGLFGPEAVPSLSGLLGALERDPHELWMQREQVPSEPELLSTSELVPVPPESRSWADEVDWEEEMVERMLGLKMPKAYPLPPPLFVKGDPPPTHPTTARNHGRPPPTARWGPNKPPRLRPVLTKRKGKKGVRARGRTWAEILAEESDEEISDDYDDGSSGE